MRSLPNPTRVAVLVLLALSGVLLGAVLLARGAPAPDPASSAGPGFAAWQGLPAPEELPDDPSIELGGAPWGGLAADWASAARARCQAYFPRDCADYAIALQQQRPDELRALAVQLHAAVCATNPSSASCAEWARSLDARGERDRALLIATDACQRGAPDACALLGQLGAPAPSPTAAEAPPPAAPSPQAQEPDLQQRYVAEQERNCAAGDPVACNNVDALEMQRPEPDLRAAAAARLRQRCERGAADACMTVTSLGPGEDPEGHRRLLDQACRLGREDACEHLRQLDRPPEPVRSPEELAEQALAEQLARQLALYDEYVASCMRGDQRACSTVAWLDYQRLGRRNDTDEAIASLEASCESGDGWGCQLAGSIQLPHLDRDAPPDESHRTVAALLRRGCELGDPDACRLLSDSGLAGIDAEPGP